MEFQQIGSFEMLISSGCSIWELYGLRRESSVKRMQRERKVRLLGLLWVSLGLVQTATGVWSDDLIFAGFGLLYALLGVAWLRFEK